MQNWTQWFDAGQNDQSADRLALLAKHENVYIKLCDSRCSKNDSYTDLQKCMIVTCANLFGYERIMFASAPKGGQENSSFDEQWLSYVDVTKSYSARHRDQLFRSNAIRVYRL